MAISPEQRQHIIAQAIARGIAQAPRPEAPAPREPERTLDEKHFKRVENFDGKGYKDWTFKFKDTVKPKCTDLEAATNIVERSSIDMKTLEIHKLDEFLASGIDRKSLELYEILCMMKSGEALGIIRNTIDNDGLVAW